MSYSMRRSKNLGRRFGVFAIAFVLFTAVVTMLSQLGLTDSAVANIFALVVLSIFIVIGFAARTMQLPEFQVAARAIPPTMNGMATAAAFIASGGFLGLAGAFFGGGGTVLAVIAGWSLGFLALSVLIAPYFRRTSAVSIADFLAIRFANPWVRLAAVVITLASSIAFLVAEISAAGQVAASFLDISVNTGVGFAVVAIIAGSLLGGMRAVTMTAIAQYIVLVIAFLAPLVVLSVQNYGIPVPHLTYGYALEAIKEPGLTAISVSPNSFLALQSLDGFNMVVLALCLAAGIASMPSILMRCATSDGIGAARASAGWALIFILIIVAAAPAYAAFTELSLLADPAVTPFDTSNVVLALPLIAGLSPAITSLVAVGALAAILAAATALLFAMAHTIGHDFFSGIIDRNGPPSRQLIVTRFFLIAVACLAGWCATMSIDNIFSLAATSLSLAASGLFPAMFLGIWWKRATAWGTFAGMVLGFAAAASYILMVLYGGLTPWQPLGSVGTGLPPMAAAFFGIPVGILANILISQISEEPEPEQNDIVEALRRPTPTPLFLP